MEFTLGTGAVRSRYGLEARAISSLAAGGARECARDRARVRRGAALRRTRARAGRHGPVRAGGRGVAPACRAVAACSGGHRAPSRPGGHPPAHSGGGYAADRPGRASAPPKRRRIRRRHGRAGIRPPKAAADTPPTQQAAGGRRCRLGGQRAVRPDRVRAPGGKTSRAPGLFTARPAPTSAPIPAASTTRQITITPMVPLPAASTRGPCCGGPCLENDTPGRPFAGLNAFRNAPG